MFYRNPFSVQLRASRNITLSENFEIWKKVERERCSFDKVDSHNNVEMNVELITPVALEEGGRFAIREGGLTVGAGVITKILD